VHMIQWIKHAPNFSGHPDGPVSEAKKHFVDSLVCTTLSAAMRDLDVSIVWYPWSVRMPAASSGDKNFDADVQSLAKEAQIHECTGNCSEKTVEKWVWIWNSTKHARRNVDCYRFFKQTDEKDRLNPSERFVRERLQS